MLLRMWTSWHACVKAATADEKVFESIGALRAASGAISAESQSAASTTVSDILLFDALRRTEHNTDQH